MERAQARHDEVVDMDMILTAEQKKDLFDSQGKMKRAAIKRTYWKEGILTKIFDHKWEYLNLNQLKKDIPLS